MQKYAHLNRDVKTWGPSYTNQEKIGQSYTVSLEKKGLIVYLAALKKGAIRAAHPSVSNNSAQPALGGGVRNPHTWTPGIIIRTNRV